MDPANSDEALYEVELDLDEHEIYQLAMEAHKRDITLNKMIESILQD